MGVCVGAVAVAAPVEVVVFEVGVLLIFVLAVLLDLDMCGVDLLLCLNVRSPLPLKMLVPTAGICFFCIETGFEVDGVVFLNTGVDTEDGLDGGLEPVLAVVLILVLLLLYCANAP